MNISYDCEDLLKELKFDIIEFGNIDCIAFFKEIEGILFLVDYIHDEQDKTEELIKENIKDCKIARKMSSNEIYEILEDQNTIV